MNNLVKINNQDLQVKEFNNQRVVTFKDIDILHKRVDGTASRNFRENRKHFVDNADYFFIKPSDIGENEIRRSEINNSGTYLITESGYLMLVKSFQDDLAWEVQRQLINQYFKAKESKILTPQQELKLHYQVLETHEEEIKEVKADIKDIRENSPLYTIECKELQAIVKKVGTRELGGHGSPAYQDKSLRTKVYADIQCQLRREFGVKRYEAIKRCQFEKAKEIIAAYKVPTVLQDQVILLNNQISI